MNRLEAAGDACVGHQDRIGAEARLPGVAELVFADLLLKVGEAGVGGDFAVVQGDTLMLQREADACKLLVRRNAAVLQLAGVAGEFFSEELLDEVLEIHGIPSVFRRAIGGGRSNAVDGFFACFRCIRYGWFGSGLSTAGGCCMVPEGRK